VRSAVHAVWGIGAHGSMERKPDRRALSPGRVWQFRDFTWAARRPLALKLLGVVRRQPAPRAWAADCQSVGLAHSAAFPEAFAICSRQPPCSARLSLHRRDICVPFPTLRRPIGPLAGQAGLRQNLACLPIVCSADRFAWEPDRAKRSACPARCYRDQLWGYPVGNATEIGGAWY